MKLTFSSLLEECQWGKRCMCVCVCACVFNDIASAVKTHVSIETFTRWRGREGVGWNAPSAAHMLLSHIIGSSKACVRK